MTVLSPVSLGHKDNGTWVLVLRGDGACRGLGRGAAESRARPRRAGGVPGRARSECSPDHATSAACGRAVRPFLQDAHAPGGDSSAPLVSRLTRRLVLRVSGCRAPWMHLPGPAGPAETSSDSPGGGVVPVGHHPPGLCGSLARRLVGGARYGGGRVARVPPDHLHWLGRRPVARHGSHAPPVTHRQLCPPPGRSQARPLWRGPGALGKVFPEWWMSLPPSQDTVQIGNQLPGLKMRSLVVGGVSEDKVSVRRGFRGCMQVGQSSGALASRLARAAHLWPLVHLLVFSKRVVYAGAQPASSALFPARAALPHGASSAPPAARHPVTVSHRQLRLHGVPRMQPLLLTPAPPSPPPT